MRPSESGRAALERIDVPWDELRAARVQRAALAAFRADRVAPRPRARVAIFALAACVALAVVGLWRAQPWRAEVARVAFADGSVVVPEPGGRVIPTIVSTRRIEVEQVSGSASYDVVHRPDRRFVVHAGEVTVEVLGTNFRVERREGVVRVHVARGRVKVSGGERTMVLDATEEISLAENSPKPGGTAGAPERKGAREVGLPEFSEPAPSTTVASEASATLLVAEGRTAAELFRQADDARVRGDAVEALGLLRELVERHPRDGRATMALFTIGRLERARGHAADAARAFAACGGALSGEALAEAALAWSTAGDPSRAKALAGRYLAAFPSGPRAPEMRGLGR